MPNIQSKIFNLHLMIKINLCGKLRTSSDFMLRVFIDIFICKTGSSKITHFIGKFSVFSAKIDLRYLDPPYPSV